MSNYWQGKGAGKKIAVRFDKPLLGDVTGLSAPAFYDMIIPPGTPTASGQYSATYTPDKAFDGSTSTYWYIRTTGDQWIQIELPEPRFTNGFQWYIGSAQRPNAFKVQGSDDGENWTDIYADTSANTTGWKEFNWTATGPYKFYRWTVTSRHSSYIYIYEIELSLGMGNANAFTVTGMVRSPLKYGPLVERTFDVESVERYPLERYWRVDNQAGWNSGTHSNTVAEGDKLELQMYASFYDDITDEIDENKWAIKRGVAVADGSNLKVGSTSDQYSEVESVDEINYPTGDDVLIVEFRAKLPTTTKGYVGIALGVIGLKHVWDDTAATIATINGIGVSAGTKLDAKYTGTHTFKIVVTSSKATFYVDGAQKAQLSHSLTGNAKIIARAYDANTYTYLDWIKITSSYKPSGTWIGPPLSLDATELPPTPRFRCETSTPDDTAIITEYACTAGDEPDSGGWAEIEDGDLLTITADTLWLRYTLTTDDPAVTPTLLSAWLEEAEAPPDTILLTMTPDSRFNDVEGDLTISYEREKGTLTGNRPVEDFTESFTPTGLEPTPLNVQGTITAGIEVAVDLIEVDHIDLGHKHTITAGITVEVDLIPVSEIPP